jgi:Ser/Thr protein kinase RdoA (MazF antagonist)
MPEMPVLPSRPPRSHPLAALCRSWFPAAEVAIEPLAAASFSGSVLYRVTSAAGCHVLKSFAPGTSAARIRFVHALMRHLRERGIGEVPAVRDTVAGETFVTDGDGQAWELQAFMPGLPRERPTAAAVSEAATFLGRVHAVAATMPENPPDVGPSPGMVRRIGQARGWLERPWGRLVEDSTAARCRSMLADALRPRVDRAAGLVADAAAHRTIAAIAALEPRPVTRQAVLRDVWSAHLLFAAGRPPRVTGLVDFHAAGIETPATDIARLLGSWLDPEAVTTVWWFEFLAAYVAGGGPAGLEHAVPFLAASGIVFGLDNWFRWVLVEGRDFPGPTAVLSRVDRLLASLPTALEILGNPLLCPGLTRKISS